MHVYIECVHPNVRHYLLPKYHSSTSVAPNAPPPPPPLANGDDHDNDSKI